MLSYVRNWLVSCSSDMTIKVWDVNNGYVCLRTLYGHDHSVSSVRVLPSGDMILSASRDKTVKLWELASGYCVKTINAHTDWIRSAITSDDGKMLLTCSNDQVTEKNYALFIVCFFIKMWHSAHRRLACGRWPREKHGSCWVIMTT